jgi:CSLREA domain-containing protein
MSRANLIRRTGAAAGALLALAGLLSHWAAAQHATPGVDGVVNAGEYGDHADGQNAKSNGGQTWYMTWDETNLYVGLSNADTTEGAVIYIDRHPPRAGPGTDADGNQTGQTYDNTDFASLPFRADFVAYYKDGYREYRTADGAGNWSAATTGFGAYASGPGSVRELAIPWSAVTGAGRPVNFSFFAYAASPGGFVYGEVPPENPGGNIGAAAVATRFYHVASTADGASTEPFSLNFTSSTRTFTVNSTADGADLNPGDNLCQTATLDCTLRAAIEEANAVLGVDTINFLILPADPNCTVASLCTITPGSALPAVTDPAHIEGYTQTGAAPNTLATGDDAVIRVELNGASAGAGADGLRFTGGSSSVRGLAIYSFTGDGVELSGAGSNTVAGNFIGHTSLGGTVTGVGNVGHGVLVSGVPSNTVGGAAPAARNLIAQSGGDGVHVTGTNATGNTVAGNYVGTDRGGTGDFGNNNDGVELAAPSNTVGGSTATPGQNAGNLIGGNAAAGVRVTTGGNSNAVAGNLIGTQSNGTAALGNDLDGVLINGAAASNTVGGATSDLRNVISGNNHATTTDGVEINGSGTNANTVAGNLIGLQTGGTAALSNGGNGVLIAAGAQSNTVGGATAGARNVISGHTTPGGNSDGVEINGTGTNSNVVAGNYIGTTAAGTSAVPNTDGVEISGGAQSNTVGGATSAPGAAPGNVISGNLSDGVELTGTNTSANTVAGNLIGLQPGGTAALGNSVTGVNLTGSSSSNTVGGASADLRNVISANGDGVLVSGSNTNTVAGNYVGTDITGALDRGNNDDGVEITGVSQSNSVGGLTATPGTAPGNVISGNNSDGVEITGASATLNTIRGNLVGLAAGGTALLRNNSNGILISNADSNTVGGSTATARNVITGGTNSTSDGVDIQSNADNTVVAGNYVGTDINGAGTNGGALDFGSGGDGVRVAGNADNNTVGGATSAPGAAPGNVISGNNSDGVEITGTGPNGNAVQGNLIGTQADGTTAYGNAAHGVHISPAAAVTATTVGGTASGAANTIAFNGGDGVFVSAGTGNEIRRNSIHSNAGLGIDLGADGVTANDADDPDAGANNLQNFPVITSATVGSTIITGTLNSTPSTTFTVEFFSSPSADPTAHGEGQTFLDSISVTTDAGGDASFTHTVAATVPAGQVVTATATDPSGNTSEFSNTRQVLAATAARLRDFAARAFDGGVLLEWRTAFEADNLGFQLYRDEPGGLVPVNPSLVAGSALTSNAALTAGQSYAWLDPAGRPGARYYLEDVDTNGVRTLHGPFWPAGTLGRGPDARPRSPLLSQLGERPAGNAGAQRQVWEDLSATARGGKGSDPRAWQRAPASLNVERQRELAAGPAVKLSVRRAGWHRVTRAQLEAAGLSPAADPTRLQLYADGEELAVRLDAADWPEAAGALEFYGTGLDTPSTDTRVYWLVEGDAPGRRVVPGKAGATTGGWRSNVFPIGPVSGAAFPRSFGYTLELKERLVYFSALLNGDGENFFGRVVNPAGVTQTLDVRHLDRAVEIPARLQLTLQGVTAVPHEVHVELNGQPLGAVTFAGRERASAAFQLSPAFLREGANELRLRAAGGPSDISLTDFARLGYTRLMRADSDRLWFPGHGGAPVRVEGFTTPDVRVVDVTDPSRVEELLVAVEPVVAGGFAATVTPRAGVFGPRQLLAFTGARVGEVADARANAPSRLTSATNAADYLVITRASLRDALAPLVTRRSAEGLAVAVVDVEDIFDEFSYGAHTPQAVRDFLAGDGSYDPRDYLGRGFSDLVPARLGDTKNMEAVSDEWFADFDGDGLSDIAVGRLPVRTPAEAALVAAKIAGHAPADARQSVLLVSDRRGADGFDFEAVSASLSALVPAGFDVDRVNRGAQDAAAVRSQIVGGIGEGQLVVNYLGHGSVNVWTGEGLLRNEDAAALSNADQLPFFVLMTCLNGHFADPALEGLGEVLLKAGRGGALASWGSSGMIEPEAQAVMNRELYRLLFGDPVTLGEAVRRAKTTVADRDARLTWVLLGDPATRLR